MLPVLSISYSRAYCVRIARFSPVNTFTYNTTTFDHSQTRDSLMWPSHN